MWSVIALVSLSAHPAPLILPVDRIKDPPTTVQGDSHEIKGSPRLAETPNFRIHCYPGCCDALQMAQVCETWRQHLYDKWVGQTDPGPWSSRCVVVVHYHRSTYRAAVGPGGQTSFGSTWINAPADQASQRRIDLLTDGQGRITALGHELSHVVLAETMGGKLPLWANEGIALLSDAIDKQARHEKDVVFALNSRAAFRCFELMALETYPSPDRIPAFYGQSASLVRMLCQRSDPQQFVTFLKRSRELGYERALKESYDIDGNTELQRLWDEYRAASHSGFAESPKAAHDPEN